MYALAVSGSPRRGGNTESASKGSSNRIEGRWLENRACKSWWDRNPWLYCL